MQTIKQVFPSLGAPSARAVCKRLKRLLTPDKAGDYRIDVVQILAERGIEVRDIDGIKVGVNEKYTELFAALFELGRKAEGTKEDEPDTDNEPPVPPSGPIPPPDKVIIRPASEPVERSARAGLRWPKADLSLSAFLESDAIVLLAVLWVLVGDGASMSIITGRMMGTEDLIFDIIFGGIGFWVGYAAFLNSYRMRGTKVYEFDARKFWLSIFAIYQILLHGCSTESFGDWNDWISRAVINSSLSLVASAIAVTTWKKFSKDE